MSARNIFFTADTHYDHVNICRFSKRPQLQAGDEIVNERGQHVWVSREIAELRVKEMNEMLISNFNGLVRPGDEVWHLGDFCLANRDVQKRTEYFVKRLNGQVNWVFGNHDNREARKADGFNIKTHYHELRNIGPDKTMFVLMHYAMRVWNKRHHGSIHLYGHSHGSLPEDHDSLSYDIGVDCHNYSPVHIDDVLAYMANKKADIIEAGRLNWKGEDHHSNSGRD